MPLQRTANAILCCSGPDGDANRSITTGRLIAYDIIALAKGAMIPTILISGNYLYKECARPVVWDERVHLANYDSSLDVYRLGPMQP